MSGYLGTKAVLLSTTAASVGGDSTVGGDLTVDTNTLYVDSTNNRVGIGNASPTQALDVTGDIVVSGGVYLGGTGSANKLDDYETGTWTPTFGLGTWTYNKQYGRYTKVGNLVTVWYSITWGARSGSGQLEVTGLPFTPFSGDGEARAGGSLGTHTGLDTSGSKQIITAIDGNINKIFYRFVNDNAVWSAVNLQDCDPTGEVQGTFTYRA